MTRTPSGIPSSGIRKLLTSESILTFVVLLTRFLNEISTFSSFPVNEASVASFVLTVSIRFFSGVINVRMATPVGKLSGIGAFVSTPSLLQQLHNMYFPVKVSD